MTVLGTVQASGSVVTSVRKDKEFRFASQADLERHLKDLMDQNGLVCALTDLEMQLDGGDDDALRVSLDRIDSTGHYERGNVQLVCKFANAWKGAQPDSEFRRLLELLRSGPQIPDIG